MLPDIANRFQTLNHSKLKLSKMFDKKEQTKWKHLVLRKKKAISQWNHVWWKIMVKFRQCIKTITKTKHQQKFHPHYVKLIHQLFFRNIYLSRQVVNPQPQTLQGESLAKPETDKISWYNQMKHANHTFWFFRKINVFILYELTPSNT